MKFRILLSILLGWFLIHTPLLAQCLQYEVSLPERVQQSSVIVEGVVMESQATWDNRQREIFTLHKVQVTKVFKGHFTSSIIEIATDGGLVGNSMHVIHPALTLHPGDRGLFLLETRGDIPAQFGTTLVYLPVAAEQGFVKYTGSEAREPFHVYPDRVADLYPELVQLTGQPYQTVSPLPGQQTAPGRSGNRRSVPPTITSFTPNPITAGTFTELHIVGNNFGSNSGSAKVEFANADNGGAGWITAPSNHIQLWTNTEIKVWVPTNAGTGDIRVTNDLGESGLSSTDLTITYDLVTLPVSGSHYRPRLVNIDGNGGYLFQLNDNFDNNQAVVDAVNRAFDTWRCGTGVNFEVSPTPTTVACNVNDGINTLTWDTACALPAGVLGRSSSFFSACSPPLSFYLVDTDIRFSKNAGGLSWNYGPGNPGTLEYDFESVVLHELGHCHQMAHIIAFGKVMHYALPSGTTQRVLDPVSDVGGGEDVMSISTPSGSCGPSPMVAVNPPNCPGVAPTANFDAGPRTGCVPHRVIFVDQSSGNPTAWEWDIDNDGTVDYTIPNPIHVYNQPGTYSIKLKVLNSSGSDSLTRINLIVVGTGPTADAGADSSTCAGKPFTLGGNPTGSGGSGPLSYAWTPDAPLIGSTTDPNPTASIQVSTTFTVVVTDTNGCSDTDTVRYTVTPGPTADAGPVVDVCEGESESVGGNPSASGGAGGYSYNWSPGVFFDDSTAANPMVTPTANFVATLLVTDQGGCTDEDTVTVRLHKNPVAHAGPDVTQCMGGSGITIGGNPSATGGAGGYTYLWQPFTGLNNSGAANPVANPPTSQVYTLTVFDAIGCVGVDSMSFDIVPNPVADAGSDTSTCAGDGVSIGGSPTASGGTPGYGYNWNPAATLDNGNAANPVASPMASTMYTVVVTDMNGCFHRDSVFVSVNQSPVADAGANISLCGGTGPVILQGNPTASGGTPGYSYQWIPAGGVGDTGSSYEVNPSATTSYTVLVTDTNGCTDQDTATVFVSAGVTAEISGTDTICAGECTQLQGQPLGGSPPFSYAWSTGATTNPITVCPVTTTSYTVTLTDGAGCTGDATITVVVLPAPSVAMSGLASAYCENDAAVSLTLTPAGGVLLGPGTSGSEFDPAVAGPGVHTLYYEVTGGNGCIGRDSLTVEVYATPPKPTITLSNDTLFTAGGYVGYKWIYNGVPIASATDTFFHVVAMGDYAVEITDTNGCTTKSDELFVDPTGIDMLEGIADIQVYPNPAGETVWVRIEARRTMQPAIRLVSVTGALVWEELQPLQKEHLVSIPVSQLAGGLYLLEIRSDEGSKWQRVIVE